MVQHPLLVFIDRLTSDTRGGPTLLLLPMALCGRWAAVNFSHRYESVINASSADTVNRNLS